MGKLTELEQWEDDIYQIETSDPVLGGPDGITNKPASQLSNRTQWLKARLEAAQNALAEHERSRNHPDATLTAKGFTQLYSGVISLDETMAATPKAVKIAMDNANARLAKDRNGADIPNVALFRQNIELGNSATRNVGTTINTVAAGDDSRILAAKKAVDDTQIGRPNQSLIRINTPDDLSNLPAGARRFAQNAPGVSVLPTNTYFYLEVVAKRDVVNGTGILAVDASNPGNVWLGVRYNTTTTPDFTWSKQYSTLNKPTASDIDAVPNTRTVNGHILDADINITSQDIFNDQAIPLGDLNLDTITTPGIYYQDDDRKASLALNYPVAAKGTLIVLKGYSFTNGSNGQRVRHPIQIFYAYTIQRGNPIYSRRIPPSGLVFGGWAQDYNTLNPPTAAAVGAYSTAESYNQTQISQILTEYVPYGRSINGKLLMRDIMLTAADVGAVPTTRTVNGKALSTNITLTAADIGVVIPTVPKNTALTAVNGWWKCGDTGLIIQWGIVPISPSGTLNYPLPMTFPNKGLWALGQSYWAMPYGEDNASGSAQLLSTAPNTTIRVTTDNGVPTAWIAIGY